MVKCVDAGKITFTTGACPGKAETVKTFVTGQDDDSGRAERVERETASWKKAEEEFKVRNGKRQASDARGNASGFAPAAPDKPPGHYRDKGVSAVPVTPDPYDSMTPYQQERYRQYTRGQKRCNTTRC